jgi:hypothetical protein
VSLEPVDRSLLGAELDACAQFLRDSFNDRSISADIFVSFRASSALIHALCLQIGSSGADGPLPFRFNPSSAIPAARWPEEP